MISIDSCRVGIEFPSVEVRYNDLRVEAECEVVEGKPLPTLWNSFKSTLLVSMAERLLCYLYFQDSSSLSIMSSNTKAFHGEFS